MNLKIVPILLPLLLSTSLFAQEIKDVSLSDSNYGIILDAVKTGYFPLTADNSFQSEKPVNRKEMALIIDKLLSGESNSQLTKVQLQELLGLSKSFKSTAVQFQKFQTEISTEQKRLDDEQKVLHRDISRLALQLDSANAIIDKLQKESDNTTSLNIKLQELKAARSEENTTMWIAIAISIILGIVK